MVRKYIVDIASGLPTILCEIDPCETDPNCSLKKQYIYADAQILAQYDCNGMDDNNDVVVNGKYYYIHDRLGSVRLLVNDIGDVNNSYTYNPYGEDLATECTEATENPYKFTGQYYDSEISQYYLRARMYDPALMRFTARDPVKGKYQNPLTLHQYLYCINNPINYVDIKGEFLAEAYAWISDASASIVAMNTAEESIINSVSVFNGIASAWMNVLFGPSDMSDSAKAAIGFVAGFGEVQIGMRTGSSTLGSFVASTFTSAANAYMSKSTDFINWGTALNIGFSTAIGGISDYYMTDLDASNAVAWWLVGVDAAMAGGVGQSAYDNLFR